ncbi:MAG TPA: DUF2382 domain-containing protein [Bryobacteraceae bacterium]|nr:DUF2382 domain-containing protein [Bryobacteraceae bacterium]
MSAEKEEIIVPVIAEQLHVDAVPVPKGGVRVVKRTIGQEHLVEGELRKDHVEVKRLKTNRIVDGPQPPTQVGNTTIIPIVEETIRIERQWVVTEEIHLTRTETTEHFQDKVVLNHEEATVERFDQAGQTTQTDNPES